MSALTQILPETGRGTIRRMVERHPRHGASSRCQDHPPVPLHQLRWSPSPCRGGIKPGHTTPVTLNLFQGPSLGLRRSVVQGASRAAVRSTLASSIMARWMLKQVQHDGFVRGAKA